MMKKWIHNATELLYANDTWLHEKTNLKFVILGF